MGLVGFFTYSFGYHPLEQKMSWEKFLKGSDTKVSNQVILDLNKIALTMLEQIYKYCILRVQISHRTFDRPRRAPSHMTVWVYKPHRAVAVKVACPESLWTAYGHIGTKALRPSLFISPLIWKRLHLNEKFSIYYYC